ncbi:MAG: SDR family oxidoreductase [Thermoguttaceae bacterium]|jgi:NADP-dependent 3-hydroxy acid dehydrogenase YdfG|nr:SDR family oxidoreductase [Thermoguttaceae bacterium]
MLDNKTVFITGAGSGIGKATAKKLLELGAKVFSLEYSASNIDAAREEFGEERLAFFEGDVGDPAQVQAAFEACDQAFGPVDVLINNAGVGIPTPDLADTEVAAFERQFDINAKGVFLCMHEALKRMRPRKAGHILTLISMAGQRTNPVAPLYCASKFAARGLSNGLADQVLKEGIKVTDVNPGPVDSNYWGDRQVPREKFLKPDDVAGIIAFILQLPEHVIVREINFDNIHWLAK